MHVVLLAALFGFVVANPHCNLNTDCPANYCEYPKYAYCDEKECNCLSPCKKDHDCSSDKTIDENGNRCRAARYCLSGKCHCGSDHIATSDGTCPTGHTAECHNVRCSTGSHLSCLNGVCTCQSDAVSGGCLTSSDCHSLQSCPAVDHHCIDRRCMCLQVTTAPPPQCTTSSQCSMPNCVQSDVHCLDGKCVCFTSTTTSTTTPAPPTTTTPPTTTQSSGLPRCSLPTDCQGVSQNCPNNNIHCIDGYCICL